MLTSGAARGAGPILLPINSPRCPGRVPANVALPNPACQTRALRLPPDPLPRALASRAGRDVQRAASSAPATSSSSPIPESIKRLFTADRVNTIAPGATSCSSRCSAALAAAAGGRRAHAPPQADAAAVPRRADARLRGGDRARSTERRDRATGRGRRVRAPPEHAGDHARGDPARGLRRRGRRAPRARCATALVEILADRASPVARSRLAPSASAAAARSAASRRCSTAPTSCSTPRSPSAAPTRPRRARRHPLDARRRPGSTTARAMDDRELRDQLMTLLLAGHETTATGLAWTFDLLLHHPDGARAARGRARRRRATSTSTR